MGFFEQLVSEKDQKYGMWSYVFYLLVMKIHCSLCNDRYAFQTSLSLF